MQSVYKSQSKDEIISGITNKTRRKILYLLYQNKIESKDRSYITNISEITKKLEMSDQALQKHLSVLLDSDLINKKQNKDKKNSKTIQLTNIGQAIIQQLNGIEFLEKNKAYFKTHTLSFLPESFVARIGALKKCKKNSSVPQNIEFTKNILENHTKTSYKIIFDQAIVDLYKFGISTIKKNNIKASYIMSKDVDMPKEFIAVYKKTDESKMIRDGQLQRKMINRANIILCIGNTASMVMFPTNDGRSGMTAFYDENNDEFQSWCNDLYDNMWGRSNIFMELNIPKGM